MFWKMRIAGYPVMKGLMLRYSATYFKQHIVNMGNWKKKLFSTNAPQPITEKTRKGFLLYHNHTFDPTMPRIFVIFGTLACGISAIVSIDLVGSFSYKEPEVSNERPSTAAKIYQSAFGKMLPYIYGITAVAVLLIAFKYVNSVARKVFLSTDHETVTFLTYGLFSKGKVKTFPVESIQFRGTKIRAKTETSSANFYLLKNGTITNKALFEWALGAYTDPKKS